MKLLRCHIENFGILSGYDFAFTDALTVLQEPNGFGKTTLAEFIRAMFYGFPRGGKSLEKNLRKKFLPWQGGKYGGNLTFEFEGKKYRIERTFGQVPRDDAFILYDTISGQKTRRFSENLGLELFGLDVDSFGRTTYFPQIHDNTPLNTDMIKAKLGGLLEDSNDVNNFEKAIETLRSKRSSYIPFRGTGGLVSEAERKISELQSHLSQCKKDWSDLNGLQKEMEGLQEQKKQIQEKTESLQDEIMKACNANALLSFYRQYQEMLEESDRRKEEQKAILARFCDNPPTDGEISELSSLFDRAAALNREEEASSADISAQRAFLENRKRFEKGLPQEEQLDACERQCREYLRLESERENVGLTESELKDLRELSEFFAPGVPDEDLLSQCQKDKNLIARLAGQLEEARLSVDEEEKRKELERFFAQGVPSEDEIERQRNILNKTVELEHCQDDLIEILKNCSQEADVAKKPKKGFLICLWAGLVCVPAALTLLTFKSLFSGALLMGAGMLFLIGAIYLKRQQRVLRSRLKEAYEQARKQNKINEGELTSLNNALEKFLERYFPSGTAPEKSLNDLSFARKDYLFLADRAENMDKKRRELKNQQENYHHALTGLLSSYFGEEIPKDALLLLHNRKTEYETLLQRKRKAKEKERELDHRISSLAGAIGSFLSLYYESPSKEDFLSLESKLSRDSDSYRKAKGHIEEMAAAAQKRRDELERLKETVQSFNGKYGTSLALGDRDGLLSIRDSIHRLKEDENDVEKERLKIENFQREHPDALTVNPLQPLPDIQELKSAKEQMGKKLGNLEKQIQDMGQKIKSLEESADQIPSLFHQLDDWKGKKAERIRFCDLLDKTINFLKKSQEQLSSRYLGGVKKRFEEYMLRLADESGDRLLVNPDLGIQVERFGAMRELTYFSVGQTDLILLCMRLSLVDELFKETRPMVILDDPFVNLDDEHTKKALSMLKKLALDHQILYLICNSSRGLTA